MSTSSRDTGSSRDAGVMAGFPPPRERRVTTENWSQPPFNRWFLKNARAVVPTVGVPAAGIPSPLARAPRALDGVTFAGPDGAPMTLAALLREHYVDGFLVLHRGAVALERYGDGMTERQPHYVMSVTKSVVSTLAGILWGRGLLDLYKPVSHYVPELAAGGYRDATVGQVLDMRSGISFVEDYSDPDGDFRRTLGAVGWVPARPGHPGSLYELVATQPQARPHGGDFAYRSIETDVIAWVLCRIAGLPLAELLAELLWRPMGAEFEGYFAIDRAGMPIAHGGLNIPLRDLARFGQLIHDEGFHNGRQIVPAEWIAACRSGDIAAFQANGGMAEMGYPQGSYSRKWWVMDPARGCIAALGIFGQILWIDPTRQLVVAGLASWPTALSPEYRGASYRACEAIGLALIGDGR